MPEVARLESVGVETLKSGRSDVFWGVDLSTKAASIAWTRADGESRGVRTVTWSKSLRDAARLDEIDTVLSHKVRLLALDHPPVFVYVEQPSGAHGNPTLLYVTGVIQLCLFQALRDHWKRPVTVLIVTSGEWKREVVAADGFAKNGQFGKPDKKKGQTADDYPPYRWACEKAGYSADPPDLNDVDATCIVELARRRIRFG